MRRCGIFAGTHGVALNGSSTSRSHTRPVSLLWHAKSWLHQAHVRRGLPTDAELQQSKSKRSIDWKRRQDGTRFVDDITVRIKAGSGGNGAISFHREKFKTIGPPSGGNGGTGASVFITPTSRFSSLDHVPKVIKAESGGAGLGTWQVGRRGENIVLEVPYGTVGVGVWDPLENAEDSREERWRKRWIHQSGFEEANEVRDAWKDANTLMDRDDYERKREYAWRSKENVEIDFSDIPDPADGASEDPKPLLLVSGGKGGLGNPAFLTNHNRSPKFASRGLPGEAMTLHLQLKLLADIGLVGFPNAGKSTLVKALTGMKTEVAAGAFTTLNPRVGVVRCWEGGEFGTKRIIEETKLENARPPPAYSEDLDAGALIFPDLKEEFRFTIADNPGLIEDASLNVGLGHSFLKSIERSAALVYVVDLSTSPTSTDPNNPPPQKALLSLREELEKYKPGLSKNARLVVANKADLLVPSEGDEDTSAEILEARTRLAELEAFVHTQFEKGSRISVIPISAKFGMNLEPLVQSMRGYVEESRTERTRARREVYQDNSLMA